jgi:3-hydroxybutyryl-CoA dehydratase
MSIEGYFLEDLVVGQTAEYARTVTEADVVLFAGISGDNNPVHMNEVYAKSTIFKGRIVHGIWSAGLISAAIAGRLPGPGTVYLSQSLKFRAPVRVGDTVMAVITVTDINAEKKRVTLKTVCTVGETVVIDGEAVVLVPSRN